MEEVYEREKRVKMGGEYDVGKVDWYRDIWPLLQRPPLLSWVNGQANGGHGGCSDDRSVHSSTLHAYLNFTGPNGPGNFFDEGWQDSLSDHRPKSEAIRRGVLGRMRLPETNSKYDSARAGQAYPYFMPWLSGDGGSNPISK